MSERDSGRMQIEEIIFGDLMYDKPVNVRHISSRSSVLATLLWSVVTCTDSRWFRIDAAAKADTTHLDWIADLNVNSQPKCAILREIRARGCDRASASDSLVVRNCCDSSGGGKY